MDKKLFDFLAWLGRKGLTGLAVFIATVGKLVNNSLMVETIAPIVMAASLLLNTWLGIDSKDYWNEHDIVKVENDE